MPADMHTDDERLIVPKRTVEPPADDPIFPAWMWIAAALGLALAVAGIVILMRMGVHRAH